MGKIDDGRLRIDREDDPLHTPHEMVSIAEIGEKRDNGSWRGHCAPKLSAISGHSRSLAEG